jgi:acyl-CoA synthetase (AMP-forming)/AMP-acid ligase II
MSYSWDFPALRYEARYGDRIVPCFPERLPCLGAYVARWLAERPDDEAFVYGDDRLSWREADRRIGVLAAALAARGLRQGDRMLLMMNNELGFILGQLAAERLGAITVPVGVRLTHGEVQFIASQCAARAILYDRALADRLPSEAECPDLVIREANDGPLFDYRAGRPGMPARQEVDELETGYIFYTSGTTGRPKGAMINHANMIHSAMTFVELMKLGPKDRSIVVVPMSHISGSVAVIATTLVAGGTLIIVNGFDAGDFLATAARERMTHTILVPTMYNLCLMRADFAAYDLSAWRTAGYGGAPMPEVTIERLTEALPGAGLYNLYGATETTSAVTYLMPEHAYAHRSSVGRAGPGFDIRIMDAEDREVPTGEIGEVWIAGAVVIEGYWDNPEATAASFCAGYWRSGDLGFVDEGGFIHVVDRAKDMICRGGYKIFSAEVEAVLASHEAVFEAAVVAKPCEVLGERVHAFVALRPEAGEIGPEDLTVHIVDRLADYKRPESWTIGFEPLPRNANGKIIKKELRDRLTMSLQVQA